MEIKDRLLKPCLKEEYYSFEIANKISYGYDIVETETFYEAWGYTEEEKKEQQRIAEINAEINNRTEWFDNFYRESNEKFTRWQTLGISESISDSYRKKTYTSLKDLYVEGEVVRQEIIKLREELSALGDK